MRWLCLGMGNGAAKERFDKAAKTGILTADHVGLDEWPDVVKLMARLDRCRTITLSGNKLPRAVPPEFVCCKALLASATVLDLSVNRISDVAAFVLPPSSPGLVLQTLNLSENPLQALPPAFIGSLPRLKSLDLSDCRLGTSAGAAAALSAALLGPSKLTTLRLGRNGLTEFPLTAVDGQVPCGALEVIDLSRNRIAHLDLGAAFPALSVVDVASQGPPASTLQSVSPGLFEQCPKLSRLELGGNDRKAAILDELRPTEPFRRWAAKHAATIDKLLAAGGADLMD